MTEWREIRFKIDGQIGDEDLTPLTLPMARFAEYLTDLAIVMGHTDSVHFVTTDDGSHQSVMKIPADEEGRITKQVQDVAQGFGPQPANAAYRRIDNRLREDQAVALLRNVSKGTEIVEFAGRNLAASQEYGGIRETASLVGKLMGVGGFDDTVPVHLQRADGVKLYCETTRDIARQLLVYYEKTIRVHGYAIYSRNKEGNWKTEKFKIQSYDPEPLKDVKFSDTIEALRAIPGNGWKDVADPLAELYRIRHGEENTG